MRTEMNGYFMLLRVLLIMRRFSWIVNYLHFLHSLRIQMINFHRLSIHQPIQREPSEIVLSLDLDINWKTQSIMRFLTKNKTYCCEFS